MDQETRRSADKVMDFFTEDPARLKALQQDPVKELSKAIKEAKSDTPAYFSDRTCYRMVIGALGLIAVAAVIGAIILAGAKAIEDTPPVVVALGSAAIGALAGLLTPLPGK